MGYSANTKWNYLKSSALIENINKLFTFVCIILTIKILCKTYVLKC